MSLVSWSNLPLGETWSSILRGRRWPCLPVGHRLLSQPTRFWALNAESVPQSCMHQIRGVSNLLHVNQSCPWFHTWNPVLHVSMCLALSWDIFWTIYIVAGRGIISEWLGVTVWAEREERLELSKVEAENSETQQVLPDPVLGSLWLEHLGWVFSGNSENYM